MRSECTSKYRTVSTLPSASEIKQCDAAARKQDGKAGRLLLYDASGSVSESLIRNCRVFYVRHRCHALLMLLPRYSPFSHYPVCLSSMPSAFCLSHCRPSILRVQPLSSRRLVSSAPSPSDLDTAISQPLKLAAASRFRPALDRAQPVVLAGLWQPMTGRPSGDSAQTDLAAERRQATSRRPAWQG